MILRDYLRFSPPAPHLTIKLQIANAILGLFISLHLFKLRLKHSIKWKSPSCHPALDAGSILKGLHTSFVIPNGNQYKHRNYCKLTLACFLFSQVFENEFSTPWKTKNPQLSLWVSFCGERGITFGFPSNLILQMQLPILTGFTS